MSWLNDDLINSVTAIWGDHLEALLPEQVHPGLSAPTRDFLTTVGLPTVEVAPFTPLPDGSVLGSKQVGDREYVPVINGLPDDFRFAVDSGSDEMFCLFDDSTEAFLANSNLGLFVVFVGRFYRDLWELAEPNEESVSSAVGSIVESMMALDPPALNTRTWWPTFLDQESEI
ncbi:SUKH-4 family immunity protein [Nocardia sp. NEAU-G5]|uniref:SUKH-4 family immunity protein n=1 Tax=Nocardia albiluteola TaxID=2842303 RepID=A0ABS6B383_9NOCA|nr:SUKH-4 family immunity protein [Nocardia albiluteola]MBU3064759.1 SUKH-4 family immunity protein [Nocardia albiluteola]